MGIKHRKSNSSKNDKRFDDMTSILESDFILSPSKIKNDSTKTSESKINKFLWEASISQLQSKEIMSLDKNQGTITTTWFPDNKNKKISHQISIYITDDVISPQSINVKLVSKNTNSLLQENTQMERDIEKEILEIARQKYQDSIKIHQN